MKKEDQNVSQCENYCCISRASVHVRWYIEIILLLSACLNLAQWTNCEAFQFQKKETYQRSEAENQAVCSQISRR